jgi:uncharacterized radical SAM superfamily Fe-S cluster-containing enzyme
MWKHIETNKYYKHTEILNPFLAIEQSEIIVNNKYPFLETTFAYLSLTNRCNLNCPYCVAQANEININIEKENIDTIQSIIIRLEDYITYNLSNIDIVKINIT